MIERNVATEENPNGPLTLNFFDYTDCLNINSKKLLQRIQSDIDYWQAHIASIGQEKEKFLNKIEEFMKRQSQELQALVQREPVVYGLKKLPLFFAELLEEGIVSDF